VRTQNDKAADAIVLALALPRYALPAVYPIPAASTTAAASHNANAARSALSELQRLSALDVLAPLTPGACAMCSRCVTPILPADDRRLLWQHREAGVHMPRLLPKVLQSAPMQLSGRCVCVFAVIGCCMIACAV
jgi:hypothetical protein